MKKKFLISFCFLLMGTFWLKTAYGSSYYYFQYNIVSNLYGTAKYDLTSEGENNEGEIVITNTLVKAESKLFDTFYNGNIIVGYAFNQSWASELEVSKYEIMQHKIDGDIGGSGDRGFALNIASYYMFNIRYNFLAFDRIIPFVKIGGGITLFDTPSRNTQGYGNRLNPAIQGALGVTYNVNNYFDLEGSIRHAVNLPKKVFISSTSVQQAYTLNQTALYLGVKFKIPA